MTLLTEIDNKIKYVTIMHLTLEEASIILENKEIIEFMARCKITIANK